MSRRTITAYDRSRGQRLRQIRETYNETQPVFAKRLNAEAKRRGYPQRYYDVSVSRIEMGSMTFEDATVWLSLDPLERGWGWFVLGAAEHDADVALYTRANGTHGRPKTGAKRR